MSKFHTAEVLCSHLNQQVNEIKNLVVTSQIREIPSTFSTHIIIQNKTGAETEPQAVAVSILLEEACKKAFPGLPHIWEIPTKARSSKEGDIPRQDIYTFNFRIDIDRPLSEEDLRELSNVRLRQQFENVRKEIAGKIPFREKTGDERITYSIPKGRFEHITPENFVRFLTLLGNEYRLGEGLEVSLDEKKVNVSISKTACKALFEKEQLNIGLGKHLLNQMFRDQTRFMEERCL